MSAYGWALPDASSLLLQSILRKLNDLAEDVGAVVTNTGTLVEHSLDRSQSIWSATYPFNTANKTSGTDDNATFVLPLPMSISPGQYLEVSLLRFTTLYNWLSIPTASTLTATVGASTATANIPAGTYSFPTLAGLIHSGLGAGYTAVYNTAQNNFTITGSMTQLTASSAALQTTLGMPALTVAVAANTYTTGQANAYKTPSLNIVVTNVTPYTGYMGKVLASVAVTNAPFTVLNWRAIAESPLRITDTSLNSLTLAVTDSVTGTNLTGIGAVDYVVRVDIRQFGV